MKCSIFRKQRDDMIGLLHRTLAQNVKNPGGYPPGFFTFNDFHLFLSKIIQEQKGSNFAVSS